MRLFIGIKTQCGRHLVMLQEKLRQNGHGRFTHPENLHITLKFLGEVPPVKIGQIQRAMTAVSAAPFRFECRGAVSFGKSGIVAAGVGGDIAALKSLHEQLETEMEGCGFVRENRPYRPHVTLARQYRARSGIDIAAIPCHPCAFTVNEIVLFESKRVDGRLVYEPVFGKKL